MATKLYEKDIDKYVDWGGDETTNGLPVSGEKIQKFIKESLDSKFGFMYYDKDAEGTDSKTGTEVASHNPTNQYIVFADVDDFKIWASNPGEGANLILANFDAPAPATIEVTSNTDYSKTILLSDKDNQEISFNYIVRDKSNNIQAGESTISININNNISGTRTLPTIRVGIPMDKEKGVTFPNDPNDNSNNGTELNFNIKDITKYLSEGINTINFTITSLKYNVNTTITYQYRVLNLNLSSTFGNNQSEFNMYKCISTSENSFNTSIIASGAGNKMLRVFIDGKQVYLIDNRDNKQTLDLYVGSNNPAQYDVIIPFKDNNGNYYEWVTEGKHNLQMYFYIQDNANIIKSQTLYYDFVLVGSSIVSTSYVLFQRTFENNSFADIVNEGQDPSILPNNSTITINAEQYLSFSTNYVILNTAGRGNNEDGSAVVVNFNLYDKTDLYHPEFSTKAEIPSGTGSTFNYTSEKYGVKELQISTGTGNGGETVSIDVNIKQSSVQASKTTQSLVLELSALNRSNDDIDKDIWKSTVGNYEAQFDKVLWNTQNGWLDNRLVLNNGATVTIPANIFGFYRTGVTFEIDFETENVQDDEAIIMTYGSYEDIKDVNDKIIDRQLTGSGIQIKACKAELQSNNKTEIHTNYKDGARQKIQFIFSYNGQDQTQIQGLDCPYLMYIVVNGILDRVAQFGINDSCIATNELYNQFTIGNTEGKVTTKIHNIRIYSRALTLDECVDNYIADSSDVRGTYLRNDIYNTGSNTINVNKILSADLHIPVMTIYGDVSDSIVQVFDKKANVPVDILYQDPMHPEFNYFARDAWMSNQGTSSMNYPRRNFRLYFNKAADDKTLRGHASNARYDYKTRVWWGLTESNIISRIQSGDITNLDDPIELNGITYKPLTNKTTLKENPQTIDKDTAIWFVHSGIKIYSDSSCEKSTQIKNLNKYITENPEGPIYVLGAYARYKEKDLYTDRWTLKCDYAESSMTHNAGIGRLWGDVMRNVEVGSEGFTYGFVDDENGVTDFSQSVKIETTKPGETNAQRLVRTKYEERIGKQFGDIRTSCDGYPIIIVNRPRVKNGNQFTEEYGDPIFLGLYNIMTDKGSTPLFGFKDLKDEFGNTIYDAGNDDQRTECWECLQNGSHLAQMSTVVTDDVDGSTVSYTPGKANNKDRLIFKTYEARWPDNDDLNDTRTDHLETVIRFVNFCKDAVTVSVDGKDGYNLNDFTEISEDEARELYNSGEYKNLTNGTLYIGVPKTSYKNKTDSFYLKDSSGKVIYDDAFKPRLIEKSDAVSLLKKGNKEVIYYKQAYAAQNVTGMSFESIWDTTKEYTDVEKINLIYDVLEGNRNTYIYTAEEDESEIEQVPSIFYENSGYKWYYYDKSYRRDIITKTINTSTLKDEVYTGRVFTYDGKRMTTENQQLHQNAWVTVYLTKNGNNYTYVNEMGEPVRYASGEEVVEMTGNGQAGVVSKGASFKGHTLFEYFQDQKYEHFDVWKLACYYVYLMRFAAVDQVIKNTMMTTEDGKHYYFINYDNDTTLGVRNDGYLVYDWQITRETYDESVGSYAYAGFGSVLWNLLEQDQDFLNKVQTVATAMVTSNVLTYDIALDMFNVKQSGTWSERLYNNSEMYKYIGTYNDMDNEGTNSYSPYQNTKYLPFVQGSRASHRDWWLRHRFDLYDSKWSAGEYATNRLDFYMGLEASASNRQPFLEITAGSKFYYTIMSNNRVLGNNFVELEADQTHMFYTTDTLILGNPMQMYGVYKAKKLDFSVNRNGLGQKLTCAWVPEKGSLIEELILGGDRPISEIPGCAVTDIANIDRLKTLKVLDIRTCALMRSIDISQLGNLRKFLADGSSITNFIPAKGVMLEEVSLPSSITTLKLNGVSVDEFRFTPDVFLTRVEIENVGGEAFNGSKIVEENGESIEYVGHNLFEFILKWYVMLKKAKAKMSDYSCLLSFKRIELMPFYGPENATLAIDVNDWIASIPANLNIETAAKKIKSLDLLNAIKKDFGLNNLGEENFFIKQGIIKLCGDNENGGLTEENYLDIKNAKFNDVKKLWDDSLQQSVFNSTSPFHFDSNESIFLTISPYESTKEPVYDEYTNSYTVIAGQKVKITATIFPINNERQINIIPASINPANNRLTPWNKNTSNVYYYAFGQGAQQSYLTNDNGTAILDIFEYVDSTAKSVEINVTDSLRPGQSVATMLINIENMVKPNASAIRFITEGNVPVGGPQEIDENREYKYSILFDTANPINVDIDYIEASFNSNTVINNNEFGQLRVDYIEEDNKYELVYLPNIQNDNTVVSLYVFVHLGDRQHNVLTNSMSVNLITKKINSIELFDNGTQLEDDSEGNINIERYVQNASEIKTSGNQKVVTYTYDIHINPAEYNVPIKSMEIVVPEGIFVRYNIIPHNSIINPKVIESIDIVLPVAKASMYQFGEFEIKIVDIYDKVINKKVNVILGYFLPDGINLIKTVSETISGSSIDSYDNSDNSQNTILLSQSNPTIQYNLHTYSKVGSVEYIWGDGDDVTNKYANNENVHFLSSEQYPNAIYSELSNNSFSKVSDEVDDLKGFINNNGNFTIDNTAHLFSFRMDEGNKGHIVSGSSRLQYNVSFNGVEAKLDKDIHVERTAALVTNFNYQSNIIEDNKLYFLDKNLNLYDLDGYDKQAGDIGGVDDLKSYFIALIYIYDDGNGNRKYTSLDPWKLTSDRTYIWWSDSGSWVTNGDGKQFGSQLGFHRLLDNSGNTSITHYEQYSDGYIFEKWYDYYRILCAGKNNPEDGGIFTLQSVGTYDINNKSIEDLCIAYRDGDIKLSNTSNISNSNMIFYYINDYKKLGISNMICKPLSSQDYQNVMNHYDTFATYLNALDPQNKYNLAKNLFDKTKYTGDSSNNGDNYPFDDVYYDITSVESLQYSKVYWYYNTPNQDAIDNLGSGINKENIQIGYDLKGDNPDAMDYKINNQHPASTSTRKLTPKYPLYCLFGPSLSV